MRTIAVVAVAILIAAAGSARAEATPPDRDNGRYSFKEVSDGFLRLDTRSGQVSLCTQKPAGWACQTLPDDRTALEDEIARVEAENALLRKQLTAHGVALPDGARPDRQGRRPPDPDLRLPSDADLDRVMSFMEKVWRRLIDMVESIQRDSIRKDIERRKGTEKM